MDYQFLSDAATFWQRPRMDPLRTQRFRDRKIRKLIRHAWDNVPYYRELLQRAGVRPEQIQGAEDLSLLPTTKKRDRQQTPLRDRLARGIDPARCERLRTSGSTGEPDEILRTRWEKQLLVAFQLRSVMQLGAQPSDRVATVGVSDQQPTWLHRAGFFATTKLDPSMEPRRMLSELLRLRPEIVRTRPNIIELILAEDTHKRLRDIGTKMVFSGSEMMTSATRRRIEDAFGVAVFDMYGAHEFHLIAWECPQCECFHTVDDSVYIEILNDGHPTPPGEEGHVVGTALHSFAMPFIRVEMGDMASRPTEPKCCPFGFERIERLHGRASEYIHLSRGRLIRPYAIHRSFSQIAGLARFQVVQTERDRIVVNLQLLSRAGADVRDEVESRSGEIFPEDVALEVRIVERIDPGPREKHRYVRALDRG